MVIDFTSTILILTSNLGSDLRRGQIGPRPGTEDERGALIEGALKDALRPEFLNRLDRVVQFRPLSDDDLRQVARRELQMISERRGIRGRRVTLEVDDAVIDKIIAEEVDRKQGARGLRRALERRVAVPVALALVERAGQPGKTERLRVRLEPELHRGVQVEVYSDDDKGGKRKGRSTLEEVRLEGDDSRLRLTPAQALARLGELAQSLSALAADYGLEARRQELEQMAQEHARPGFWTDAARAAREFARYNRLSFQVRRLERLQERLQELQRQSQGLKDSAGGAGGRRRAPLIDAIAELSARLEEADLELRHFNLDGDHDEADALLRLRPEVPGEHNREHHAEEEMKVTRQLWEMYAAWAQRGPRRAELLYLPAKGGLETPLLIGVVSGPLAFGYLRRETGLHRFRLRRGGADGPGLSVLVRAQVYPVQLEGETGLAPREALSQSLALKLTVDEAAGPRRVRSAVLGHSADGQVLAVQNERDVTENRALARRLLFAIDAFPDGGRPVSGDPLVRSYERAGNPVVKDTATGFSTGRVKDVMAGELDEILRLRVRQLSVA